MKPIKYELLKEINEALEKEGYYYTPDFWQGDSETVYYKTAIVGPKQAKINGLLPRPTMEELWNMLPHKIYAPKKGDLYLLYDPYNFHFVTPNGTPIVREHTLEGSTIEALIKLAIWVLNNTASGLNLPKY